MDELTLHYNGNKLEWVSEAYMNSNYPNDIEGQASINYTYDKIGNLISDVQEGITGIFWNVYGNIREIRKGSTVIKYHYDAAGNRVYKNRIFMVHRDWVHIPGLVVVERPPAVMNGSLIDYKRAGKVK